MKKIITIDCDNVLCDTAWAFTEWYNNKYQANAQVNQIKKAYMQENSCFSEFNDNVEYYEFFVHAHEWDNMSPVPWSVEWIARFLHLWYELHVITWREDRMHWVTSEWIEKHYGDVFSEIHYCNDLTDSYIPKWSVCKEIGAVLHVDDFDHYAKSITEVGIPVFLLDFPRNSEAEETDLLKRIKGWDMITDEMVSSLIHP